MNSKLNLRRGKRIPKFENQDLYPDFPGERGMGRMVDLGINRLPTVELEDRMHCGTGEELYCRVLF